MDIFQKIIKEIDVISLDKPIYDKASDIYAKLRKTGQATGEFDMLIASTALVNNFSLTTNNTKDYLKIKDYFGLKLQNWV